MNIFGYGPLKCCETSGGRAILAELALMKDYFF
jgi:hypothetical protein